MTSKVKMSFALPLFVAATLALSGCAGKRWAAPGEYLTTTRGTGVKIIDGPFADQASCSAKIPQKKHGQVYVCVYLPVRPGA